MFPTILVVFSAIICAEIKQLGAEPNPSFRVSTVDAGRPLRFKFRPQPLSSFQHVSSGYGSPARYFHAPRPEAPRSPSYYFASLNGGSIFPETLPLKETANSGESKTKAFSPFIGARAISNLEKFFEYLRENVEAMKEEEAEAGEDGVGGENEMQNDMMETAGGDDEGIWGAAPSTPSSGHGTSLHRRTPFLSKEAIASTVGKYTIKDDDALETLH